MTMEYLGDGLYVKPCADGSIDLIEDRPAGRQMINFDHARTNAVVAAMRRHWLTMKPTCVLCGQVRLIVTKGESDGARAG